MPETPESQAIREQTAAIIDKLDELKDCMIHSCEDYTVIATSLEHMAETMDFYQKYFTGEMVHEYKLPPELVHPDGGHPKKED